MGTALCLSQRVVVRSKWMASAQTCSKGISVLVLPDVVPIVLPGHGDIAHGGA